MQFTLQQVEDWEAVVKAVLPQLQHNVLLLKGNLGAGKTTFTKFLLKRLGSTDEVDSPTYSIVNEYRTPGGTVAHFDLYRLKNAEEVFDIGISEYLDSCSLNIIEWPEVYFDELSQYPHHEISIKSNGENREVFFK